MMQLPACPQHNRPKKQGGRLGITVSAFWHSQAGLNMTALSAANFVRLPLEDALLILLRCLAVRLHSDVLPDSMQAFGSFLVAAKV